MINLSHNTNTVEGKIDASGLTIRYIIGDRCFASLHGAEYYAKANRLVVIWKR